MEGMYGRGREGGREGWRGEGKYLVAVVELGEVDVLPHIVSLVPQVRHHLIVCFGEIIWRERRHR